MIEGMHAGLGTRAEDQMYSVYNLTPNMWEEPWVSHLLGDLPISRYEVRDLWSPPPAAPRKRRVTIFLESLIPSPLRPTRRRIRRVLRPHDHCICIYNTWGLDHAVRRELGRILSHFDDVGIVSVDEPTRDSKQAYEKVTFAVRVGFDAEKYRGTSSLMVVPLGVPKNFVRPRSTTSITDRRFVWSFLGEVKNSSRRNMVEQLERVRGDSFVHSITTWNADDSIRGTGYSDIIADSVFVPSPPANVHRECYRTYEALECDAIPVVDTDYYRRAFGAPFPIVQSDWADAPQILNTLLDDTQSLEKIHQECRSWWQTAKTDYPRRISALAEASRARHDA
jgi:hypothetical protein